MRKLIESTFVTLDGVIGDPQVWGSQHEGDAAEAVARLLDATVMDNGIVVHVLGPR